MLYTCSWCAFFRHGEPKKLLNYDQNFKTMLLDLAMYTTVLVLVHLPLKLVVKLVVGASLDTPLYRTSFTINFTLNSIP